VPFPLLHALFAGLQLFTLATQTQNKNTYIDNFFLVSRQFFTALQ